MVSRFSDGEIMVEIQENVRGKDVFVLQSTCAPTNDTLMELMIIGRRAEARVRRPYYRSHPLFWIRPPGSPSAFRARGDIGESRR